MNRGLVDKARQLLGTLGPGFITGASDDDPSGIGTYAIAGAKLGYAPLWTALVTFPLMSSVQWICAKVGLVTGMGLAGVLRDHYPRWLLYSAVIALVVANTINLGADLSAIAASVNLLVPALPELPLVIPVGLAIVALQIIGSYRVIARIFKWLTLALLAYIGSAILAHPDWGQVLRSTLVPTIRFDGAYLTTLVAILGTTISPYLFFWQAEEEVEEEKSKGHDNVSQRKNAGLQKLRSAVVDVNIGMLFSNVVMYFIILGTAATLNQSGHTDIESAADAAQALKPLAGDLSSILLAVGLIGSGLLAVPILSGSAAYAASEALGWRRGLDEGLRAAPRFYAVIIAATAVGVAIDLLGIRPFDALFWSAVLNGLVAPPLLLLILLVANNRKIMGNQTNACAANIFGGLATLAMALAALGLIVTLGQT
jgi:NRAMP (natural resistance-associated macrophage protein)-like metal ion transporter